MNDEEFNYNLWLLEQYTGDQFAVVHIYDDGYIVGTDTIAYYIKFPYPMYRDEAINALLYVAKQRYNP